MNIGWVTAAALLVGAGVARAQPANELSAAARSVFRAFPHANRFRRIVRDVDQKARRAVEQQLPFKVHFNELGPHTLYVPFRRLRPVGLMYVRTEDGGWGFSEISWALGLDLRIVGFRFLRSRSPHRFKLQKSPFSRSLVGLGYEDLAKLLDADGKLIVQPGAIPKGSEELALAVTRSAMKTLLVTRTVWHGELGKLQDLALGLETFPAATRVQVQPVRPVTGLRREHVQSIHAVRAYNTVETDLGIAVQTESSFRERVATLRWALTPKLKVIRVAALRPKDDARLRAACTELTGRSLVQPGRGSLAALARELAAILRIKSPGKKAPVATPPGATPLGETTLGEKAPAEKPPEEKPPEEKPPEEKVPAEKGPAERGPVEKRPVEKGPGDTVPREGGPE